MNRATTVSVSLLLFGQLACSSTSQDPANAIFLLPSETPKLRDPAPTTGPTLFSNPLFEPVPAKADGKLSLTKVLKSVQDSFPLLEAAEQDRVIKQAKALSARGAFDLTLKGNALYAPEGFFENHSVKAQVEQQTGLYGAKFFAGYRIGSGDFDLTFDGKRRTNHGGELFAGASLPLLEGGITDEARTKQQQADLDIEVASAMVVSRRIKATKEASKAYWQWVASGRQLRIAQGLLGIAEIREKQLKKQVEKGLIPKITLVDNERLLANRNALVIAARREFQAAGFALSLFLRDEEGRPQLMSIESLPADFPKALDLDRSRQEIDIARAMEQNPKLRALALKRTQFQIERKLRRNQQLPTLDFSILASEDRNDEEPSKTKGGFELYLGLEFKFPIQRRKAIGLQRAAEAKLRQITAEERFMRDSIRAAILDLLSEINAQSQTIVQTTLGVDLSKQLAKAERKLFDEGSSDLLRVNLREEAVAKAQMKQVKAQKSFWVSIANYKASLSFVENGLE